MKKQQSRYSYGFTLLEALVVVLLIGILSAIAAPSWLAFLDNCRLNIAQREVHRTLRAAQNNAAYEKITWQASFREKNEVVQWAVHPATVEPVKANWNNLDTFVRLDPETTLESLNNVRQIQFDYRGNVRKPPFGNITLSSKSGGRAKRCVYVSTILGAMRTAKDHPRPKAGRYCY